VDPHAIEYATDDADQLPKPMRHVAFDMLNTAARR